MLKKYEESPERAEYLPTNRQHLAKTEFRNVEEALRPDAPLIMERLVPARTFADLIELLGGEDVPATSNANFQYKLRLGDVEAGLRQADRIFEHTFSNPASQHGDLEYHCSVARWVAADRLEVWSATQSPSYVRAGDGAVTATTWLPRYRVDVGAA